MNKDGRVPICGQISQYHKESAEPLPPLIEQHLKNYNVDRRWFMVFDYKSKFEEAWLHLLSWVQNGQIKIHKTEYDGIDSMPKAFCDLFRGKNIGKLVVKISN